MTIDFTDHEDPALRGLLRLTLSEGQKVAVTFKDLDGAFIIEWATDGRIQVTATMPDTQGRDGVIYEEWRECCAKTEGCVWDSGHHGPCVVEKPPGESEGG